MPGLCKRKADLSAMKVLYGACMVFFFSMGVGYNCRSIYLNEAMKAGVISGELMSGFWALTALLILTGAFFTSYVIKHTGLANTILIGGIVLGLGYILLSEANATLSFIISSVILGIGGVLTGKIPVQMLVMHSFYEHRSYYLGILSASAGLGAVIGSPVLGYLINAFGWREITLYSGIAIIIISSCCCLWLIKGNYTEPPHPAKNEEKYNKAQKQVLIFILLFMVLGNSISTAMTTLFQPIMTEKGFELIEASKIFAVYSLMGVASSVIGGKIADRFGFGKVFLYSGIAVLTGLFILYFTGSSIFYTTAAILISCWGVTLSIFPLYCASKLFPKELIQKTQTLIIASGALSIFLTSAISGLIFNIQQAYINILIILIFAFCASLWIAVKLLRLTEK